MAQPLPDIFRSTISCQYPRYDKSIALIRSKICAQFAQTAMPSFIAGNRLFPSRTFSRCCTSAHNTQLVGGAVSVVRIGSNGCCGSGSGQLLNATRRTGTVIGNAVTANFVRTGLIAVTALPDPYDAYERSNRGCREVLAHRAHHRPKGAAEYNPYGCRVENPAQGRRGDRTTILRRV